MTAGSDLPAGWDHPSSWQQRLPIVALAAMGTLVAGYLAAHSWRCWRLAVEG